MAGVEGSNRSKRHHYVPRFYLNRFANQRKQLHAFRRSSGKHIAKMGTERAAVESGFYDIVDADGTQTDAAEKILSRIETEAAPALQSIVDSWPPNQREQSLVANFAALQAVRTRETRHTVAAMYEGFTATIRDLLEETDQEGIVLGGEYVEKGDLSALAELNKTESVFMTLELAAKLVEPFMERSWALFRSKKRLFATSDVPVIAGDFPEDRLTGSGYLNADFVILPIDSRHLLMMRQPGGSITRNVIDVGPATAERMSGYVVWAAYEWAFSDPRSPIFDRLQLPVGPRPLGSMGGLGGSYRDLWGPGQKPDDSR